eukprot:Trichotokara_eunicae@DN31_c1_g1_i1.p1
MTMDDVFIRLRKGEEELSRCFIEAENGDKSIRMRQRISGLLNTFNRDHQRLLKMENEKNNLTQKERLSWQRKITKLSNSSKAFTKMLQGVFKQVEDEQRIYLTAGNEQTIDTMKKYLKEEERINESDLAIQELIDSGTNITENIYNQNQSLKNIHKKGGIMVTSVNFSKNILSLIERRNVSDRWLAYGGMFLVIAIFAALYYFVKKKKKKKKKKYSALI